MAKNQNPQSSKPANGKPQAGEMAPDGFRPMSSDGDAPWWHREEGAILYGQLLGQYELSDKERREFFQVQVKRPTKAVKGKKPDTTMVTVEPGGVVSVGINFKLDPIRKLIPKVEAGGVYDIWAKVGKKIDVSGGHTMWTMDVRSKMIEPPKEPVVVAKSGNAPIEDEDSPF